ncbi:MAG: hypothetical protein K2K91_08115 [Ruminococcus sp.]|nr:hypothetical protein [Ruminococcus sp.]
MKMYVLQVKSGREFPVCQKLRKSGISVYCPTMEILERRRGRLCGVERLVFPQYVFIECDLTDKNYRKIRKISEVIKFLGADSPEPLKPHEKEYVKILGNDGKIIEPSGISVSENGEKSVVSGILKQYQDKIVNLDPRNHRAKIELDLCGKKHTITLPVTTV